MYFDHNMDKHLAFRDGNPDLHGIHMFIAYSCQITSTYFDGEPLLLVSGIWYRHTANIIVPFFVKLL